MLPKLLAGELVCLSSPDELPEGIDRSNLLRFDLKSTVAIPLSVAQRIVGVVSFGMTRREREWPPEILQRLLRRREHVRQRARPSAERRGAPSLARRSRALERSAAGGERVPATRRRQPLDTSGVGQSAAIRRVHEQVCQVAETDATVLLLGETGSGKEVFAARIHELSRRRARAMVRVNCAAIPATLIESELFGREKGAYTGALSRQIGRFELADRSTIFLDEIGDLAPDVQVKLLRVLEDKQIERLGSSKTTKIDTRIIAATHRDLEKRIEADTFREDLYYRLNVFPIRVPPLRERIEDIPLLVWRFVEEFSAAFGKRIESIAKDNIEMLQRYPWPGNVRELRNLVERALIAANGPRLTIALPQSSGAASATQRQARRCRKGAHQGRARQHEMADSRHRRRRRTARAQSDDARDAHGETGTSPAAPLTPTFRAPSAIRGILARRSRWPARLAGDKSKLHRSIAILLLRSRGWYVCCSRWRVVRLAVALAAPAGGTDQLVHALRLLASPTRIEPGCLGCRVWTEDNEATTVRYVEEWATEDAMRLRVRSTRFTRLLEVLESAPAPPRVEFDFVTETRGLDYVAEVRDADRRRETGAETKRNDRSA